MCTARSTGLGGVGLDLNDPVEWNLLSRLWRKDGMAPGQ